MARTGITIRYEKLRRHFSPILEEWTKLICRYTEEYDPKDALYWYNERATLSTLAHAIVRTNSIALEEYRMKKHSIHDGQWEGRADLFFVCGKTEYVAEAKQMWLSISSRAKRSRWRKRIAKNSTLQDARLSNQKSTKACRPLVSFSWCHMFPIESRKKLNR